MFDYATLKFIWWLLLGVLLIGFAIMDGFDLGVGMLLPSSQKTIPSVASSSIPWVPCGKATRYGSFWGAVPFLPRGPRSTPRASRDSTSRCSWFLRRSS